MNQPIPSGGFVRTDAPSSQRAAASVADPTRSVADAPEATAEASPPLRRPILSSADLPLIREALFSGEVSVARRSDITELHARLVRQLATLGDGLSQAQARRAEADAAAAIARLQSMETAVNRMEGALRIEFEPVLRRALEEVVGRILPRRGWSPGRALGALALLLAGIGIGLAIPTPLSGFALKVREAVAGASPSPDGGIGESADPSL